MNYFEQRNPIDSIIMKEIKGKGRQHNKSKFSLKLIAHKKFITLDTEIA